MYMSGRPKKNLTRRERDVRNGNVPAADLTGTEVRGILERAYSNKGTKGLDAALGKLTARSDFSSLMKVAEDLRAAREARAKKSFVPANSDISPS